MGKLYFIIIFFFISFITYAETKYELIKVDGEKIIGYIVEDKPSISIIFEDEKGELYVVPYKDILIVRPFTVKKEIEENKNIKENIEEPIVEPKENVELIPKLSLQGYSTKELSEILIDLNIRELYLIELDLIEETTTKVKSETFGIVSKSDTFKYTLLNLVPGLGSLMQGDYATGLYTLSSVLGAVAYNSLSSVPGEDLYFIINLNAVMAYVTSFFGPYRYNLNYNQTLKDKLQL